MSERNGYLPGAFSWVELSVPDPAAAVAFYGDLFGWHADRDVDRAGTTTFRLDGAAVSGLGPGAAPGDAPSSTPAWTSFVTVADAATAVARAVEAGGTAGDVVDVADAGRAAEIRDPQGAALALWQPGTRFGAEHVNDVGCLCMNELATADLDAARAYYEALFGWATEVVDTGPDGPPIASARNGEQLNASFAVAPPGVAPHWRPYFTVESVEHGVGRVRELGGTVAFGPVPISDGGIAVVFDPQGAVFGLFEGEVDP